MQPQYSRYYTYIRPLTRNKFIRSYATTVFSLIAIAIFGFYAIRPTIITILSLQKTIDQQRSVLSTVVEKRDSLAKGRANYESLEPDVKTKLQNLIPSQPDLPVVSAILGSLIIKNEATISGIQFQPVDLTPLSSTPNKDAAIQESDLSFSILGSYDEVTNILTSLKKLERLITVKTVTMNRLDGGTILAIVNAKTYFLKN
jgi:Tfp pilus assembly protein PilO